MKAIYAFYSKPFGGIDIRKAVTHWSITHVEFTTLAYSVLKSKAYGFETVLFCDKYGKELIIDTFGIPFDIVKVELDNCEIKRRFWAAGKIYAYSKGIESLGGFEPFVMIDNDAGWHMKPPAHFFESRYRCQQIHNDKGTFFETQIREIVRQTKNEFPYDIYHEAVNNPDALKGGNAGVVVLGDETLWREFTRYTWALMESPFFDKLVRNSVKEINPYRILNKWNVLVEENLLYLLNRRINKETPQTVLECIGFTIPSQTYNPTKYFHIWGHKKNPKFLNEFNEVAISYIPNEISHRIYSYFNLTWQK